MIDGFKLKVEDLPAVQQLFHHPKLDFKTEVSVHTGEQGNIHRAMYRGLRFEYLDYPHRQTMYLRGSLPLYHPGVSNHSNMPISTAWQALRALIKDLGLDIIRTQVIKLEWGLNIVLPEAVGVNRFIRNVLVYKGKTPSRRVYEEDGLMYVIDLNEFSIKIYNKGAQYKGIGQLKGHANVLRYELRITRKSLLNRMDIDSLIDLFSSSCIEALQQKLLETVNHLVFYDYDLTPENIPAKSKALFLQYGNPVAWSASCRPTGNCTARKERRLPSK